MAPARMSDGLEVIWYRVPAVWLLAGVISVVIVIGTWITSRSREQAKELEAKQAAQAIESQNRLAAAERLTAEARKAVQSEQLRRRAAEQAAEETRQRQLLEEERRILAEQQADEFRKAQTAEQQKLARAEQMLDLSRQSQQTELKNRQAADEKARQAGLLAAAIQSQLDKTAADLAMARDNSKPIQPTQNQSRRSADNVRPDAAAAVANKVMARWQSADRFQQSGDATAYLAAAAELNAAIREVSQFEANYGADDTSRRLREDTNRRLVQAAGRCVAENKVNRAQGTTLIECPTVR